MSSADRSTVRGRCIWITGASSGIGRSLAMLLGSQGNYVIVSARDDKKLRKMARDSNGKMAILPFDLAGGDAAWEEAGKRLGDLTDYLDLVICCAGICEYEDNLRFDPSLYQRTFNINMMGVVRAFNLSLPLLRRSAVRAQFAAVGSLSSIVGLPRAEAYGASKAALDYFMRSLKADLVHLPIDITLVRPGFVDTALTKSNDFTMPLLMSPDNAAQMIIKGIGKRRFLVDFPLRVSWSLRLCALFFPAWCRWVAPGISRIRKSHWQDIARRS